MLSDASDLNFLADQDLGKWQPFQPLIQVCQRNCAYSYWCGDLVIPDEFVGHLKKELSSVEGENEKISHEIEELSRRYLEGAADSLWFKLYNAYVMMISLLQ